MFWIRSRIKSSSGNDETSSIQKLGIHSCLVFTDSTNLVHNFSKFRCGVYWDPLFNELKDNNLIHKVSLIFIPRHLNQIADEFAKQGAKREAMIAAWYTP